MAAIASTKIAAMGRSYAPKEVPLGENRPPRR